MTFKRKKIKLILQVILLFITLAAFAWFLTQQQWWPAVVSFSLSIFFAVEIIRITIKSEKTILEFIEAVKYNDYSLTYNTKTAPKDMQHLYKGLNTISESFKNIIREKNTEKTYLQKILEMVNIGIISFNAETGEIFMINECFKDLTNIPYAKNIHAFEKRNHDFLNLILHMKTGQSEIFSFKKGAVTDKLLINATLFKTGNYYNKLIAIQNVNEPLNQTESRAWQKLLNVMTHEIMNSVAPISSLADTLIKQLDKETAGKNKDNEDLLEGLHTIKKRSDGLQRFAVTYRNLNKITKLNIKEIFVRDIFENLQTLMQPTLDQKNIELDVILKEPDLKIKADTDLIEQVLINLLTNAIEAVKEVAEAHIVLSAYQKSGKKYIRVVDNGIGMSEVITEQIFIPFFSTRKNGNGIGLSLCKQIILLHKGTIQVFSEEGKGTAFVIGL
ncbi:sensor histidine kinase [Haoranjiania flava]|uniref:histidine kinase n=1 Tax=Haoranjiania flava TaxID=1856322 RepID=A0AAE3IR12_9BACT|nr:HAMP domain-containing sensor histidine kinase [Haoranjiania flava]MCU7694816.1 HAMP domain-containing histidine kinase [Haoranjiania flava]